MNLSVSLPEELYRQIAELAARRQVSVQELAASALAQQLSGWQRIEQRASRGDRSAFLGVLDKVQDQPTQPGDEMPTPS